MHITLTTTLNLTYDVDLQSLRAVVMNYSDAKLQSVDYKHTAANKWDADESIRPTCRSGAVGKKCVQ